MPIREPILNRPNTLQMQPAPRGPRTHTNKIEFLDLGANETGDRFLKRRVGADVALVSVAKLISNPNEEFTRLQRAGVALLQQDARREFMERVQNEAGKKPTFQVAMQPGLLGGKFHFPDDAVSIGRSATEFYPDERHANVYRKFHRAGTRRGWMELCELSRGNSRLMLGYALACSGLICGAFGFEPPGVQFVGLPGSGKSTAAKVASTLWGWDLTPGALLGFGSSWKSTPAALENIAAACNHTLLFLDEMSKASAAGVQGIMTISQGQGTARYTELHRQTWCAPLLSTANASVVAIMKSLGLGFDAAYVDRLMDVPLPADCACFFEDIHGFADLAGYEERLRGLAEKHHGRAGRVLASRFTAALSSSRDELKIFVAARRTAYQKTAANIVAKQRDLVRVHGRFATIFAAGCIGIRFGILPFTRAELLQAILTCERDHVAFIDQELGIGVPQTPLLSSFQSASLQQLFECLRKFINSNRSRFIDLRKAVRKLPRGQVVIGYIGVHRGRVEYWILNGQFETAAGGKREAQLLKAELIKMGLLSTEHRGAGLAAVVKRPIPGASKRTRVVAIRARAQKSFPASKYRGGDHASGRPRTR